MTQGVALSWYIKPLQGYKRYKYMYISYLQFYKSVNYNMKHADFYIQFIEIVDNI